MKSESATARVRGLIIRAATIFGLCTLLSGCFLLTISGVTNELDGSLITSVENDALLTTCVQSNFNVSCTYFVLDENGVPVSVTSSSDLISEFGVLGVIIDPLIFQIPGNATNVSGTYVDENGLSGDLIVRSGFKSVPADAYRFILAEPGRQLVIAELPDGLSFDNVEYRFALQFEQPAGSPTPVTVKPMLTLKFTGNGQEFYPPQLPCTTDFASLPEVTVPLGDGTTQLQPVTLPAGASGCAGEQYPLLGFGVEPCDFDGDFDVDRDDIAIQTRVRNAPAVPGDRLDANGDGWIDINDARRCSLQCMQPNCASMTAPPVGSKPVIEMGVIRP